MIGILFSGSSAQSEPDSSISYETKLNAYPYAYYTPKTQLAFGAGGVMTFYTKRIKEINP